MMTFHSSPMLRRLLLTDAIVSGATGLLMLAAAPALQATLGLPLALVRYAGLALLPFAALVLYFARTDRLSRAQVWSVIVMNAAWVAASVVTLVTGWIAPNPLGIAFVLVQALAVAGLAELQYSAIRTQSLIPNP
jgi:hypothetical protein